MASRRVTQQTGDGLGAALPIFSLFTEHQGKPPLSFLDTMAEIHRAGILPGSDRLAANLYEQAQEAKQLGEFQNDSITVDAIAALFQYSAESRPVSLYADMNDKCYKKDRSLLGPYIEYMWLLLHAMKDLPPYEEPVVFRGVKMNLRANYTDGRVITWHGFTSTTKSMRVMEKDDFCGQAGDRTVFVINLKERQARDISRYSLMDDEAEVLLPPGSKFKVQSSADLGNGLVQVFLTELPSTHWIVDLRGDVPPPGPPPAAAETLESGVKTCDADIHGGEAAPISGDAALDHPQKAAEAAPVAGGAALDHPHGAAEIPVAEEAPHDHPSEAAKAWQLFLTTSGKSGIWKF